MFSRLLDSLASQNGNDFYENFVSVYPLHYNLLLFSKSLERENEELRKDIAMLKAKGEDEEGKLDSLRKDTTVMSSMFSYAQKYSSST